MNRSKPSFKAIVFATRWVQLLPKKRGVIDSDVPPKEFQDLRRVYDELSREDQIAANRRIRVLRGEVSG